MNILDGIRDYESRAFTIGVGGAPASGARPLLLALCRLLRTSYSIAVVTSERPPSEDDGKAFLIRHKALASERIARVQAGGSLHAEFGQLMDTFRPDLLFVEGAGGDSGFRELADFTIHVVDAAADGIPAEESECVAAADVLVINRTQPCSPVDASLNVMAQDAARLRGDAPVVFAQIRYGLGVIEIARHVLVGWRQATAPATWLQSSQPGERPSAE
jgi:urease accessory protein